jgi:hypothetical protein
MKKMFKLKQKPSGERPVPPPKQTKSDLELLYIDGIKLIGELEEKVRCYEEALEFYAKSVRSGLHEDGGNLARRTLEKFTNSN